MGVAYDYYSDYDYRSVVVEAFVDAIRPSFRSDSPLLARLRQIPFDQLGDDLDRSLRVTRHQEALVFTSSPEELSELMIAFQTAMRNREAGDPDANTHGLMDVIYFFSALKLIVDEPINHRIYDSAASEADSRKQSYLKRVAERWFAYGIVQNRNYHDLERKKLLPDSMIDLHPTAWRKVTRRRQQHIAGWKKEKAQQLSKSGYRPAIIEITLDESPSVFFHCDDSGVTGAPVSIATLQRACAALREPHRPTARTTQHRNDREDQAQIRARARAHGYKVNDRGRLPVAVVEQYRAAGN